MRLWRFCTVETANIYDPKARQIDEENVKNLMASMRHDGLIEPIVVVGRLIVSGVHRWEAARRLGIETLQAIDITGLGDVEIERIMIAENHCRKEWGQKINSEELAKMVALQIPVEMKKINENAQTGKNLLAGSVATKTRPPPQKPTAQSEAIRAVAVEKNLPTEIVRDAVRRQAARVQKQQSEALAIGEVSATLDTRDNPIPAGRAEWYRETRRMLKEIDRHMRAAQSIANELHGLGGLDGCQHAHQEAHAIGHWARQQMPLYVHEKCGGNVEHCRKAGKAYVHDPHKETPWFCTTGFIHEKDRKRFEKTT